MDRSKLAENIYGAASDATVGEIGASGAGVDRISETLDFKFAIPSRHEGRNPFAATAVAASKAAAAGAVKVEASSADVASGT